MMVRVRFDESVLVGGLNKIGRKGFGRGFDLNEKEFRDMKRGKYCGHGMEN